MRLWTRIFRRTDLWKLRYSLMIDVPTSMEFLTVEATQLSSTTSLATLSRGEILQNWDTWLNSFRDLDISPNSLQDWDISPNTFRDWDISLNTLRDWNTCSIYPSYPSYTWARSTGSGRKLAEGAFSIVYQLDLCLAHLNWSSSCTCLEPRRQVVAFKTI
jgi:hypothetical protein